MTTIERINEDLKASMKAQDATTLSTLRMLKSALKNKQIDLMRELTEEEALAVLKSQIKQLKDSVVEFEKANRADLADPAKVEVALLEKYLPAQMDDATLATTVKSALEAAGFTSKADMGRAMGVAVKAVAGQADGGRVKAVVESLLACLALVAVMGVLAAPDAALAASSAASHPATTDVLLPTLRIMRSFLMLIGIAAINVLLVGGFTFMTASGRDESHEHGLHKMGFGVLASVAVACMFAVVTSAIQRMQ